MKFSLSVRMRVYLSILICVVVIGVIGLEITEQLSHLDALYFLTVTIATVGYGDIHPVTPAGKILVMILIITGVGCFVGIAAHMIESVIEEKERKSRLEKLNMIIGSFFSEVGVGILKKFSAHDPSVDEIRSALVVSQNWSDADFARARSVIEEHSYALDSCSVPMEDLYHFLMNHKAFLLSMLHNPRLLEHDSFTPLIQALYHLTDEMMARERLTGLPPADCVHLSGDLNRVYRLLLIEWLGHMQFLKHDYPFLFSLAMRQNPFDKNASVIVQ
ncbi:MAG: potassium channel family protein [Methanoregula sp.]|nr:potassium channel family protein [Methanoregula sp.]